MGVGSHVILLLVTKVLREQEGVQDAIEPGTLDWERRCARLRKHSIELDGCADRHPSGGWPYCARLRSLLRKQVRCQSVLSMRIHSSLWSHSYVYNGIPVGHCDCGDFPDL